MATASQLIEQIKNGQFDAAFGRLYDMAEKQVVYDRFVESIESFIELFGDDEDVYLLSAPGRTEICGNHTDHNLGCVAAAGVNLDVIAVAAKTADNIVTVKSKGFDKIDIIDLSVLEPQQSEREVSASLIRGIANGFSKRGYAIGGYNAYTTSNVLKGSGLSSSAAFETLVGVGFNELYNNGAMDAVEIAKIGQYAENEYFGKPSGLMDQMASSVGSFIFIDFKDPQNPVIKKLELDLKKMGLSLVIVDTGGNHADLTYEYAAIPAEMRAVAAFFGAQNLREVDEDAFYASIKAVREQTGDRAVVRAHHFFTENKRVSALVNAVDKADKAAFLRIINASGDSSYKYNQNIYPNGDGKEEGLAVALAMSQHLLGNEGASRVHGGGFAGTIQAFVPDALLERYLSGMRAVFGQNSCYLLQIRGVGGTRIA